MRILLLFIFVVLLLPEGFAQRVQEGRQEYENSTDFIESGQDEKRKFAPVKWVMGSLMFLYQKEISNNYKSNCMYHPSCSNFSKHAIREFGWLKGIFLSADRIQRCNLASINEDSELYRINAFKFFDPPSRYKVRDKK